MLLAWLSNKSDLKGPEKRLSSKIERGESRLESKIDKVDSRIDTLRAEMNGLRKAIYEALIPLHECTAKLEARKLTSQGFERK